MTLTRATDVVDIFPVKGPEGVHWPFDYGQREWIWNRILEALQNRSMESGASFFERGGLFPSSDCSGG